MPLPSPSARPAWHDHQPELADDHMITRFFSRPHTYSRHRGGPHPATGPPQAPTKKQNQKQAPSTQTMLPKDWRAQLIHTASGATHVALAEPPGPATKEKIAVCLYCPKTFTSDQYRDQHVVQVEKCRSAHDRKVSAQALALTDMDGARGATKEADAALAEGQGRQMFANLVGEIRRGVARRARGSSIKVAVALAVPHHTANGSVDEQDTARGASDRKRYTVEQQATHIDNLEMWCKDNYQGGINARGAVAAYIRAKMLPAKFTGFFSRTKTKHKTGWLYPQERTQVMQAAADSTKKRLKALPSRGAMYPDMERELSRLWKLRRMQKRKVSARWLQRESIRIMKDLHPKVVWKASPGWRCNYCLHRVQPPLVPRGVTNVKKRSLAETGV